MSNKLSLDEDLSDEEQAQIDRVAQLDAERELAMKALESIKELKRKKRESSNELVDSDTEDSREEQNAAHQTSYFRANRVAERDTSSNEQQLRQRIEKQTIFKKRKQGESTSFADRIQQAKIESSKNKMDFKSIIETRDYSFDIEDGFKPLDLSVNEKEKYSGQYINKRYIKSELLDILLKDKKLLRIENLLSKVSPPDFKPPEYSNYVVFGMIVGKSDVKRTSDGKGKFITITISNFTQELKLNLFGKAFDRYWQLRVNDIVAILNPYIYPFRTETVTSFCITLKHDAVSIVEIGRARDISHCKYPTKSGTPCGQYYNITKTDYCGYHTEQRFNKGASKRLELTGSVRMFSPKVDGVTKAMYMDKTMDRKSGTIMNDVSAPVYNRREEITKQNFTSREASNAFFDEKYHNSNHVSNMLSQKAVIQAKKKEVQLRKKLSALGDGQMLRSDDMYTKKEIQQREKTAKLAYSSKAKELIGFDPTRSIYGSKKNTNNVRNTSTELSLMMKKETQKSSKVLTASAEEIKQRKAVWKATYNEYHKKEGPQKQLPAKPKPSSDIGFDTDSDDDIDFEDFSDKKLPGVGIGKK